MGISTTLIALRRAALILLVLSGSVRGLRADPTEATITAPTGSITVAAQQTVSFTASSSDSTGQDGFTVNGFSWSFGDGAMGTGASATHVYTSPGSYTATLTVSYSVRTCKRMDYLGNCTSWITTNLTATASRSVTVTSTTISAVSPANASVDAGSTVAFSATVSGASNPGVAWAVSGGGSISLGGVFTATTAGTFTVTATSVADPSKRSSTSVAVRSLVTGVVLTPSSISLKAGESTTFTAQVQGPGGPNPAVTWSANGGSIGSSGAYTTPLGGGPFTVTATSVQDPTKKASAMVSVASISVGMPSPSNATLDAGKSLQFSAMVSGAANPAVTWSVSGGGTISASGLFTATTAGTYVVTAASAADPGRSASATVVVRPVVTGVNLTPSTANLKAGETIVATAQVMGLGGPAPGVTWTATAGSVTVNGVYTAPLVGGQYTLTATSIQDPTKKASMTVTVSPVVVSVPTPGGAVVDAGSSIQFSATVGGAADPSVRWSVSGGGSIGASGLFSATTAGTYAVTATSQANPSQSASTSVTVKSVVSGMTLTVPKNALGAGESIRLTATVSEVGGGSTAVTWAATAGSIASSGDGTYVAPIPGAPLTVQVTATSVQNPTVLRTISLSVSAVAVAPVVPANPSVDAGRSVAFASAVTGAADTGLKWSVTGGGSISASGVFTAATAGTYTVTAASTADPRRIATTVVTVRAVVSGVSVTPTTATLNTGQTLRFGAVVSGLGIVQGGVTWSATSGSIAADGTYTAPGQPGQITITATSLQDPTKRGTASLVVRGWVLKWKKDIVYVGTKEIGEVDAQGLHVTLVDHLGSPRFLVNGTGMVESEQKFLPFGESLTDPTTAAAFAKGFTNHEQTDPSGLIYMQARFYAPWYGRFLSPDPARDQHFEETQSWNIYSYVRNSPAMAIDFDGMEHYWIVVNQADSKRMATVYVTRNDGSLRATYDARAMGSVKTEHHRNMKNGDTPYGTAIASRVIIGRDKMEKIYGKEKAKAYGEAKINLIATSGELQTTGRAAAGVAIHGGGTPLGDNAFDGQQPLLNTQGCIRMHNDDVAFEARQIQAKQKQNESAIFHVGTVELLQSEVRRMGASVPGINRVQEKNFFLRVFDKLKSIF